MSGCLKVLFLAAEADPLVKVGGLGDVAGSLPRALLSLSKEGVQESCTNLDIRLVIPFHGGIRASPLDKICEFEIQSKRDSWLAEVWETRLGDVPVYLVGGPLITPDQPVYTSDSYVDGLKFTFFCQATLELARRLHWSPNILHANDWHTAPAVYALKELRKKDPFWEQTKTVLSLHNLPYMGVGAGPAMAEFGLPPAVDSSLPLWALDVPLALGLWSADHIVAVSPTYAREILTPEFGCGLDPFLRSKKEKISGIINGLDKELWNPETDPLIVARYGKEELEKRKINKTYLQAELALKKSTNLPLLAMISRMDFQKGVDLLPQAIHAMVRGSGKADQATWQLVILGTGDQALEKSMQDLSEEFPKQVRAIMKFDADMSHRIYAGADMLLIPSRYEPCGLVQMIAMSYGCVPIARSTGGLRDTVLDYSEAEKSTGFVFEQASADALAGAISRALRVYRDRETWRRIQQNGMAQDFSWQKSAGLYLDLYKTLVMA